MAVATLGQSPPAPVAFSASLLADGYRLMRQRLGVYLAFAVVCAVAAWFAMPQTDMYAILSSHPMSLVSSPPVSVVLGLALIALFFILPSALRGIDPSFRMTALRGALTVTTIVAVGVVTEIGYVFAIVPGIVAAVLLSQALMSALLGTTDRGGFAQLGSAFSGALRGSVAMTKSHFATTLCVVAASLCIVVVPFSLALVALAMLGVTLPPSLTVTAPLLFLTFIYFECVRYALLVRWYRHLSLDVVLGGTARP